MSITRFCKNLSHMILSLFVCYLTQGICNVFFLVGRGEEFDAHI